MARPKTEQTLKRTHAVMIRFNDTEYSIITTYAQDANLPVAEYGRKLILNQPVNIRYEITADTPEIKKLIAEFGKIGSNLNQIARHLNREGAFTTELKNTIQQCISTIYELKYDVTKMTGAFHGHTETHSK